MKMINPNYGIKPDIDTKMDLLDILMVDKVPTELCAIINRVIDELHNRNVKVMDAENPDCVYLDEIRYDKENDEVFFWTETEGC